MREIIVKLFKFDELTDRAKEKARDWYRSGFEYPWYSETQESLKGFAELLPIVIKDYSYGEERGRSYVRFNVTDENVDGLKGLRLRTWLINNFWNRIEKGRYQSSSAVGSDKYKSRRSNVTPEVSCPFTGYCADEDLIDPIRDFIKRPNEATTFEELITECFESFINAVASDIEYQMSDEAIDETISVNEYEFTEDGERA